jgi:hypothetical protein
VYRLDAGAPTARLVGSVRDTSFVDGAPAEGARYCVSGLDRSANSGRVSDPMGLA